MTNTKWFSSLTATTPTTEAARIVLQARARTVSHYLSIMANGQTEDPEDIHQLRVATRRLGAALSMFQDALRASDYRRLRRMTRAIRRAASAARDLDVHRDLIAGRLRAAGPAATDLAHVCASALQQRRLVLTRRLVEVARTVTRDFSQALLRGLARLRPEERDGEQGSGTLGEMARRTLRRRLKCLRAAGREDLTDLDSLHQLRIAAKRLRYSMEVFAGCFPVTFRRQCYRVVERIQEDLGRINDLRTLVATIEDICAPQLSQRRDAPRHASAVTVQQLRGRLKNELRILKRRFVARWDTDAQRQFHRRVKALLKRPVVQSRIHGMRISQL